jgi:hypothetical protein
LFLDSPDKCCIEIGFSSTTGEQKNIVRDKIRRIAFGDIQEKLTASKEMAIRLARCTDDRSHPGLLIIFAGRQKNINRVTIWKFAADKILRATQKAGKINLKLMKNAFSKKSTYFKAVVFEDDSATNSFWEGLVEDKQAKSRITQAANYWIVDFLNSKPSLTNARGTFILSRTLKGIIQKSSDLNEKRQIIAAADVIRTQLDRPISMEEFANRYLPSQVRGLFIADVGEEIAHTPFYIETGILLQEIGYKILEVEQEFSVQGPMPRFNEVVTVGEPDKLGMSNIILHGRITSMGINKKKRK